MATNSPSLEREIDAAEHVGRPRGVPYDLLDAAWTSEVGHQPVFERAPRPAPISRSSRKPTTPMVTTLRMMCA